MALDRSPLALAYRVEGDVTLAGDGLAHRLAIAMLEFKAGLKCMWQAISKTCRPLPGLG